MTKQDLGYLVWGSLAVLALHLVLYPWPDLPRR